MASFAEFTQNKLKKKLNGSSFEDFTRNKLGRELTFDNDIAPVITTGSGTGKRRETVETKKEEEKERKWFQKGAFEDGYQFGDVTKTILGSDVDLKEHLTSGLLKIGEGAVDTFMYLAPAFNLSQQAQNPMYQFDIEDYRKQQQYSADFIKKDIVNEEKIAKTIITEPAKKLGIDAENDSVFGEKSDALAESAGQLVGTAGLQAVGVPWFITTGATAFGSEAENALKQGATYEQAGGSALITAGAEILTEKLSGGIKFGGKTLDDVWLKPLTEQITNKTVRALTNVGLDAIGEGSEEVISSVISNLGTALYKEEDLGEILASEEALDGYIESFIGGAVLGGGISGVNAIREGKANKTTYTANEQSIVDKVVEERVKEQEKYGKTLSKKEIGEIEKDVKNSLERGEIDIDTIESALGGETYNLYDSVLKESQEYEQLYKTKDIDLSQEQRDRRDELIEKNKQNPYKSELSNLRERLSQEVRETTKNDTFLTESYNQKAQKGKAYEADLTKYEGKQQEVVKKAMESGILNNTRRTHEFVDMIAKLSADKGVSFDFTDNKKLKESGFALEGKTINGYVKDGNITLNLNSSKALNTVVGHEITHVLEGTDFYDKLQTTIFDYAKAKGEFKARSENIANLYNGRFKGTEEQINENLKKELTADLVGDYLFTDSDFINNLSTTQPNVFKKIYDEIKYLLKIATAGSKEARELEKVKKAFDKAYKATTESKVDTTQQMLSETYVSEVDNWYNDKEKFEKTGGFFRVGKTSDALKSIGVKEQEILFDQSKIKKILNDHPEITIEVIKEIPQALENPVIVMQSKTATDSITVYGEVYANVGDNQQPVMVAMELMPSGKSGRILDVQKISSAYVRGADNPTSANSKAQSLIDSSEILYVDPNKKRTNDWLSAFGLRLPVGITNYGPIGNVTYFKDTVKDSNEKVGKNTMAEALNKAMNGVQLSLSEDGQKNVYGFKVNKNAKVNEDLLEELSVHDPSAEVDENGNVTVYHRTTVESAEAIRKTGVMKAQEDALFFSSKDKGYASDYGEAVVKLKIPSTVLEVNDIFDGEVHFDIPLKYQNGGFQLNVSKYLDNNEVKYSLSEDTEGHTLTKEQQEYFKESKIRDENGNLKVMYHGSPASFSVFDKKKARSSGYYGSGFYFTESESHAGQYGSKYETYLDIKNPMQEGTNDISKEQLRKFVEAVAENEDYGIENYGYGATVDSVTDSVYGKDDFAMITDINATSIGDMVEAIQLFNEINGTNYDGIIAQTETVAFYPEQIKDINNTNPTDNPDINLSLSSNNDIAPTGKYNVYGKDILLEQQEDIGPVREDITPRRPAAVDYAPLTEAEANERDAMQGDRLYSLNESDMPEEVEAPMYDDELQDIAPVSPFEEKDIQEVGNRKQKAYMYENPEVKPFFQEEANIMLGELHNSVKGERFVNANLLYETNGEFGVWGTKRQTSEQIAYMLDRFNYTYAEIEKGLKAIIEDHGAENNAVSKRLEFMLDERLREGYQDLTTGIQIPANEDYIALLTEKQINDYSDEAYNKYLESLAYAEAPTDLFPDTTKMVEDIAPIRDDIPTTDGVQRVMDFESGTVVDEEETPARKTHGEIQREYVEGIKTEFTKAGLDFDKILENATNKSTFASVDNTPQRYIEKTLGYKEGQLLNDLTINKEALNESKAIKWLNSFTNRKDGELAKLSKSYGIKPNSKEDAAAQMYAEGFYINDNNEYVKYGDEELAKDFPDVDTQNRIKGLVNNPRIRQIYDETLTQINESRVRNGYPEIPRRSNYYLHFRAMDDTFSRLGIPFNPNDIKAKDLPTDINGMTADLKPGQPYFASANRRTGLKTSHSLIGGMERYLTSAKNQIYHIDDIQTLRGLRNYIADMYGQAHGLENLDTLTEEEAEARVKDVYDAHLSTFAKFLNEQANVLAGKTSLIDRGLEGVLGRRGIQTLNTINSQVAKNMVGFNVSSSLTGFVSTVQGFAKANKYDAVKAFTQVASNKIKSIYGKSDGFAENDPTMIRRKGAEKFYRTPFEKVSDLGYSLMSGIDNLSTEFIIRARYNELTRKGMNSEKAQIEAGKWAMRILGDRSLGQQPQLYNSKMLGLVTKFQLEVRNQLDSMIYDTIQETKLSNEDIKNRLEKNAKTASKITSTMVQLAVFQHLFGKAFESVAGYNPTFDIIGTLMTLFGFDDEEEKEDDMLDNAEQALLALLEDLPYTSTFTGGRIPIESALPIEQLIKGKDNYGNDKPRGETVVETLPYYLLPGGYGQLKKTTQGLTMFDEDLPISGSYTDSGNLRFPVEDTLKNRVQAAVFGQWSNENARAYFDNERQPLKEKQIEEFAELDIPIKEYWKYRDGLKEQETLEDKFDYIANLDLPIDKKNIMINNIVDRKEEVDLTNYNDFSDYEEFDFAIKYPEKYEYLQSINVSYSEYNRSESAREAYNWAYKNPEKYLVSKTVSDVVAYRDYTKVINDIEADKDANGKAISGSRKDKVIRYIDGLNLDYGAKLIMFKSEYPSDNTYNMDIINYLDSLENFSFEEKLDIATELGFTVEADGTIRW